MRVWLLAGLLAGCVTAAHAHSHVRIAASSELVYAADGALTGLRNAWTFDETFTAYALQDVEPRTKGVYTRDDLAPLAETNALSLREFGYFSFAKADGRKVSFAEPIDYYLEYKNSALTLHFTLPLKTPLRAKELAIEVLDPTGFNDFRFVDRDPVRLVGAPSACKLSLQRPSEAPPDDKSDDAHDPSDGAKSANRITVSCP